mgnify:CR=1 FL=1
MKLTEAVQFTQPLFEGFKDLENTLVDKTDYVDPDIADEFSNAWTRMFATLEMLTDPMAKMFGSEDNVANAKNIKKAAQLILDHDYSSIDLNDILGQTKGEGPNRINSILEMLIDEMDSISDTASLPEKRPPQYEVVDNDSDYTVYELHNYSAARKFCNYYDTRHCIGSSDTGAFDQYGQDKERDTFAIATSNGRLVIVHSGPDGYLITSHDNKNEYSDTGQRGEGINAIFDDLIPPLDFEDIRIIFSGILQYSHYDRLEVIIDRVSEKETPGERYSSKEIKYIEEVGDTEIWLMKKNIDYFIRINYGKGKNVYLIERGGYLYEIDFENEQEYIYYNPADDLKEKIRAPKIGMIWEIGKEIDDETNTKIGKILMDDIRKKYIK